jgi:very-short-patch-repair endonuclease
MRRDSDVNRRLAEMGWRVLRVWEHEIEGDLAELVRRVNRTVRKGS